MATFPRLTCLTSDRRADTSMAVGAAAAVLEVGRAAAGGVATLQVPQPSHLVRKG